MSFSLQINPSTNYTQAPTTGWVSVSEILGVNETTVTDGGSDESLDVTPGSFSCYLDNTEDAFTVDNAGSPYYPNIKIPTWVRFSIDGVAQFTGLADGWYPTVRGAESWKATRLTATDVLKRLATRSRLGSFVGREVIADTPVAYYSLGDGADAYAMADQTGTNPPLVEVHRGIGGTLAFGGDSGLPHDDLPSPAFHPNLGGDVSLNAISSQDADPIAAGSGLGGSILETTLTTPLVLDATHAITVEWWVKFAGETIPAFASPFGDVTKYATIYFGNPSGNPATGGIIEGGYFGAPRMGPAAGQIYAENGAYYIQYVGPATDQATAYMNHILVPDQWYHMVFVVEIGGRCVAYINGQRLGYLNTEANISVTGQQFSYLGLAGLAIADSQNNYHNGSIAHVALYNHTLSAARVMQHFLAGKTGFAGEALSDRVARIIRYAGMGTGNVEQADLPVAAQNDEAPADALSRLAISEQGVFFIDPAGIPTFYNRSHRYDPATPTLTLDATQDIGDALQPLYDDQKIVNDVRVVSPAGTTRVFDAASQAAVGEWSLDVQSLASSSITAADIAAWIVATRKGRNYRLPDIVVDILTCSPAVRTAVLAAKLFDRIHLTGLPAGFAALGDLVIRGRLVSLTEEAQSVTFHAIPNPATAQTYRVGVAGSDEVTTSAARLGW